MPTPSDTFLANVDIAQYVSDTVLFLNATWTQLLAKGWIQLGLQNTVSRLDPIEYANAGTSGSCATACASAVVTNIQGFSTVTFASTNTKAQFYTCGKTGIVLNFDMTATSMTADVTVQGYSALTGARVVGLVVPVTQSTSAIGSVTVTLPWNYTTSGPQIVDLERALFSVALWPVWTASVTNIQVPDTQLRNVMNDAIQTALQATSEAIVEGLRSSVSAQVQKAYEYEYSGWTKHPISVSVAMPYTRGPNAVCDSGQPLVIPNGGCDPCDVCCQCYAKQSCNGKCAECPCINCPGLPRNLTILFASFVVIFTASYLFGYFAKTW